jgi:hypothetical protein
MIGKRFDVELGIPWQGAVFSQGIFIRNAIFLGNMPFFILECLFLKNHWQKIKKNTFLNYWTFSWHTAYFLELYPLFTWTNTCLLIPQSWPFTITKLFILLRNEVHNIITDFDRRALITHAVQTGPVKRCYCNERKLDEIQSN